MGKIRVYEKSKLDLDFDATVLTVTDATASDSGQDYVDYVRDRTNFTGWGTTGSNDAALTQMLIDTADAYELNTIALIEHNFKAYTLQYWDGANFVNFSTPINETVNVQTTNFHVFNNQRANLFKLIVQGTHIVDADKLIRQIIFTRLIGEFEAQPEISRMQFNNDRKSLRLVSGKRHISQRANSLNVRLRFPPNKSVNDANLVKNIFDSFEGRLFSFVGGDHTGIANPVSGFNKRDIFLMIPTNDLDTAFKDGFFNSGQEYDIDLAEAR